MGQQQNNVGSVDVLAAGWKVSVYPAGHGQWAYTAGPRSGVGFRSKAAAQEAGERELQAALARCGGAA